MRRPDSLLRPLRRAVLARRRLLAAALAAVAVAAGLQAARPQPPTRAAVLVAAHDLPAGTRLPDAGMAALLRVGDRIDLVAADPQHPSAEVVAAGVPVLALPATPTESGATGLTGRLVVVGAAPGDVTRIADASVRTFVTIAFTD